MRKRLIAAFLLLLALLLLWLLQPGSAHGLMLAKKRPARHQAAAPCVTLSTDTGGDSSNTVQGSAEEVGWDPNYFHRRTPLDDAPIGLILGWSLFPAYLGCLKRSLPQPIRLQVRQSH
jgi:hypothetical protein